MRRNFTTMLAAMAFGAVLPVAALAQQPFCMTMGNMTMCQDGRMMMNGMWFAPPAPPLNGFVIQNQIGPGETAMWSTREFINPDGSRTQRWERTVRGADGSARTQTRERIVFPDGRVCEKDGPTMRCM